jgi:hypothetical protein
LRAVCVWLRAVVALRVCTLGFNVIIGFPCPLATGGMAAALFYMEALRSIFTDCYCAASEPWPRYQTLAGA